MQKRELQCNKQNVGTFQSLNALQSPYNSISDFIYKGENKKKVLHLFFVLIYVVNHLFLFIFNDLWQNTIDTQISVPFSPSKLYALLRIP